MAKENEKKIENVENEVTGYNQNISDEGFQETKNIDGNQFIARLKNEIEENKNTPGFDLREYKARLSLMQYCFHKKLSDQWIELLNQAELNSESRLLILVMQSMNLINIQDAIKELVKIDRERLLMLFAGRINGHTNINEYDRITTAYNSQISQIKDEKAELLQANKDHKSTIKQLQKEISSLKEKDKSTTAEIDDLQNKIKELEALVNEREQSIEILKKNNSEIIEDNSKKLKEQRELDEKQLKDRIEEAARIKLEEYQEKERLEKERIEEEERRISEAVAVALKKKEEEEKIEKAKEEEIRKKILAEQKNNVNLVKEEQVPVSIQKKQKSGFFSKFSKKKEEKKTYNTIDEALNNCVLDALQSKLVSYGLNHGVSEDKIKSMIENNLSADQMRTIIELNIAKQIKADMDQAKKEEDVHQSQVNEFGEFTSADGDYNGE